MNERVVKVMAGIVGTTLSAFLTRFLLGLTVSGGAAFAGVKCDMTYNPPDERWTPPIVQNAIPNEWEEDEAVPWAEK